MSQTTPQATQARTAVRISSLRRNTRRPFSVEDREAVLQDSSISLFTSSSSRLGLRSPVAPLPRNCQMRRSAANAEATADALLAWLGRVGPARQRLRRRATGPGEPPRHKLVRPRPEPGQTATTANLSRSPIVLIVRPSGSLSGPPARGVGSEGLQFGFCER
jgi:hypothetical protein